MIIAFEGIDGSGKTTLGLLVATELVERGYRASFARKRDPDILTSFPAEQIAALSTRLWGVPHDERLETLDPWHWVHLNASYFCALGHAIPNQLSAATDLVLLDNWIYKFAARIAITGPLPLAEVLSVIRHVPAPDLVIYLDLDPELALQRRPEPTELERGELVDGQRDFIRFQERVRGTLRQLATANGWQTVVAGTDSPPELAQIITERIVSQIKRSSPQGGS